MEKSLGILCKATNPKARVHAHAHAPFSSSEFGFFPMQLPRDKSLMQVGFSWLLLGGGKSLHCDIRSKPSPSRPAHARTGRLRSTATRNSRGRRAGGAAGLAERIVGTPGCSPPPSHLFSSTAVPASPQLVPTLTPAATASEKGCLALGALHKAGAGGTPHPPPGIRTACKSLQALKFPREELLLSADYNGNISLREPASRAFIALCSAAHALLHLPSCVQPREPPGATEGSCRAGIVPPRCS